MEIYLYRALDEQGKKVSGEIRAESREAAIREIRNRYPVLTSLKEQGRVKKLLSMDIGRAKTERKELALLCSQLSLILGSGMSADRGMELAARQTRDKGLKKMLTLSGEEISRGSTVAESFEKNYSHLPGVFLESVRAGEEAGSLEQTFRTLGKYYGDSYKMRQKLRQALAYPAFVLAVALAVLAVVMLYVVPSMTQAFSELGGSLPFITRVLIGISGFLGRYLWLITAVVLLLLAGFRLVLNKAEGRLVWDRIKLRLPVAGKLQMLAAGLQFSTSLETLLTAGIHLGRALEITGRVLDNRAVGRAVSRMAGQIQEGRSLGTCLGEIKGLPDTLGEMCRMGEETGELENTLGLAGKYFENELGEASQRAIQRLEPTVLILMALFAGFIVLAVYLPMFRMYELL